MQDLTVEEDGTAEFICQYSRPVQATWWKNDQELHVDGQRIVVEQDWNVAKLKIRPALPGDTGIYTCEAGGTKVVAMLDVQGEIFYNGKKTIIIGGKGAVFTAMIDSGHPFLWPPRLLFFTL